MKLRDGDLMTTADAAAVLGLSNEMVTKLRRAGRLPVVRTPSGWCIFLAKDVLALAAERRKAPRGGRLGSVRVPVP